MRKFIETKVIMLKIDPKLCNIEEDQYESASDSEEEH